MCFQAVNTAVFFNWTKLWKWKDGDNMPRKKSLSSGNKLLPPISKYVIDMDITIEERIRHNRGSIVLRIYHHRLSLMVAVAILNIGLEKVFFWMEHFLLDVGKYIKICCAKNIYYLDNIYILRYNMTIQRNRRNTNGRDQAVFRFKKSL